MQLFIAAQKEERLLVTQTEMREALAFWLNEKHNIETKPEEFFWVGDQDRFQGAAYFSPQGAGVENLRSAAKNLDNVNPELVHKDIFPGENLDE